MRSNHQTFLGKLVCFDAVDVADGATSVFRTNRAKTALITKNHESRTLACRRVGCHECLGRVAMSGCPRCWVRLGEGSSIKRECPPAAVSTSIAAQMTKSRCLLWSFGRSNRPILSFESPLSYPVYGSRWREALLNDAGFRFDVHIMKMLLNLEHLVRCSILIGWITLFACCAARAGPTTMPLMLTILSPDGNAAPGALVVTLPLPKAGYGYVFRGDFNPPRAAESEEHRSDADGMLTLQNLGAGSSIAVFHPSGYLETDLAALSGGGTVKLLPWARVEGRLVRQGGNIAGQTMKAIFFRRVQQSRILFLLEARTDAHGRFVFDRLPPGKGRIGRVRAPLDAQVAQATQVELLPAKTTTVMVGGIGRTIIGRVQIPPVFLGQHDWICDGYVQRSQSTLVPPMPDDVRDGTEEQRVRWMTSFSQTEAGKAYTSALAKARDSFRSYPMETKPDGTFRIEDVLPGSYELDTSVYPWPRGLHADMGEDRLAEGFARLNVPDLPYNADEEPLEIRPVAMNFTSVAAVGEPAPGFAAPTLDGRTLRLSDFRGHYVLLDFWSTWCGPCVEELPNLKAVYSAFGRDGRLDMIGLSLDEKPQDAKRFVQKNEILWNQAWIGDDAGKQTLDSYPARWGIPQILLIGPDGMVIANNLRGNEIKSEVGAALTIRKHGNADGPAE
jgi:thiol-disulfide isomerase/thioredoxin